MQFRDIYLAWLHYIWRERLIWNHWHDDIHSISIQDSYCDYVTNSGPQTLPFKDTRHSQSAGFPGHSPRPHPHRQPTHPHLRRHAFIGVYIAVLIFYARQSIIECEWRTDLRTPGFWLGGWNIIGIGPSTGQGIKGEGINCEAQAKARICKGWSLKGH